jgi:hypothetical protein
MFHKDRIAALEVRTNAFWGGYAKNDRFSKDKHKEMLKKEAFFPQGRDSSPTMTPQMHQSGDEDTEEEVYCWHGTGGFDAENIYADTQDVSTVQYSTVQYSTVQYSTVQYSTVQYSTMASHCER